MIPDTCYLILLNAALISLFTTGLWIASDNNMLLEKPRLWLDKLLAYKNRYGEVQHYWLYKPLLGCPYCMTSLHGAYIFTLLNYTQFTSPAWALYYLITITCATGLNAITIKNYNS